MGSFGRMKVGRRVILLKSIWPQHYKRKIVLISWGHTPSIKWSPSLLTYFILFIIILLLLLKITHLKNNIRKSILKNLCNFPLVYLSNADWLLVYCCTDVWLVCWWPCRESKIIIVSFYYCCNESYSIPLLSAQRVMQIKSNTHTHSLPISNWAHSLPHTYQEELTHSKKT